MREIREEEKETAAAEKERERIREEQKSIMEAERLEREREEEEKRRKEKEELQRQYVVLWVSRRPLWKSFSMVFFFLHVYLDIKLNYMYRPKDKMVYYFKNNHS